MDLEMNSIDKLYNENKKLKEAMNYNEDRINFLEHRVEALENQLNKKIKQAIRIIKKLRNEKEAV
jgi:FtsZ-binding cell division protein ZapB